MEDLVELGREFVQTIQDRRGISHVAELYTENAESVEAVVLPGRELRIAKGAVSRSKRNVRFGRRHTRFKSSTRTGPMSIRQTGSLYASKSR